MRQVSTADAYEPSWDTNSRSDSCDFEPRRYTADASPSPASSPNKSPSPSKELLESDVPTPPPYAAQSPLRGYRRQQPLAGLPDLDKDLPSPGMLSPSRDYYNDPPRSTASNRSSYHDSGRPGPFFDPIDPNIIDDDDWGLSPAQKKPARIKLGKLGSAPPTPSYASVEQGLDANPGSDDPVQRQRYDKAAWRALDDQERRARKKKVLIVLGVALILGLAGAVVGVYLGLADQNKQDASA